MILISVAIQKRAKQMCWVVHGYKFLAPQSPQIWILPSMTLHVTLYLAPGDESLATQSTMIWILYSINLLFLIYMVQGDKTLATQSFMKVILPRKTLHVSLHMFPRDPSLATQGLVSLTPTKQIRVPLSTRHVTSVRTMLEKSQRMIFVKSDNLIVLHPPHQDQSTHDNIDQKATCNPINSSCRHAQRQNSP